MQDSDFMPKAWEMAEKCQSQYKFGSVISKDGKIIAADHNHVSEIPDISAHAEISVIRKACLELDDYNLEGCTLYATHEPCMMCFACAMWAGINRVVYEIPKNDQDDLMYESSLSIEELNESALHSRITVEKYEKS